MDRPAHHRQTQNFIFALERGDVHPDYAEFAVHLPEDWGSGITCTVSQLWISTFWVPAHTGDAAAAVNGQQMRLVPAVAGLRQGFGKCLYVLRHPGANRRQRQDTG